MIAIREFHESFNRRSLPFDLEITRSKKNFKRSARMNRPGVDLDSRNSRMRSIVLENNIDCDIRENGVREIEAI